jgi:hypothetical protein
MDFHLSKFSFFQVRGRVLSKNNMLTIANINVCAFISVVVEMVMVTGHR